MENSLKVPVSATIALAGEKMDAYIAILCRLVEGGRLNKFYPDAKSLSNMLSFMNREKCQHLYDSLTIGYTSGLPIEKEITRVIADKEIAIKTLEEDSIETLRARAEAEPNEVNIRRLNRYLYHKDLLASPIPSPFDIQLKLRKLDTEKYIAYFNVELNRFNLTTGKFVKYTLVVGQKNCHWASPQQVLVIGDELKYTEKFRNLLSKYTVNEAEFAFILLNDLEDVVVEEVQRCSVGPLYFNGVRIPEGMEEIFKKHPETFILSLPCDRASIYLKEDKNNDPLKPLYRETLDEDSRKLLDKKAEETGYHVYKERKFVCTRGASEDFQKFLKNRGARCVVYGV